MSIKNRRQILTGAVSGLLLSAVPSLGLAQGLGGYDDDRLYRDEQGNLYRRRGGDYVPYRGRVSNGRPVADPEIDLDAEAYARRRAERYGEPPPAEPPTPAANGAAAANAKPDDGPIDYAKAYAAVQGEPFPVPAFNWKKANPSFLRQEVAYTGSEAPGTIVVDPKAHHLYLVLPGGRARRYGVGVGKQGFSWSGASTINAKQAWPDWYPPKEMIARKPALAREVSTLQSGLGVPGGSRNPLGARAMYLWQNNKDTLYRIHGTTEPASIGRSVSSGCIRMINQDAIDLFSRVEVGAKVVVLG
ncbi:L,D-transpeptidase [Methylobacterium organophilum]|uniref:L,D-transpeptidase n=1 Tax=Methylobacterium organophilum TaxID=410 RepID=UPI001F143A8C|nr:L,D-transpeptidase [Methylobacterium organophilum]UMY18445.1 L,D-transpeptidase [Methylobacterium organophilum]